MADFEVWASRGSEPPQRIGVAANSAADAASLLRAQGYVVLGGAAQSGGAGRARTSGAFSRLRVTPGRAVLSSTLFAEQLASLLNAGIGPIEALRALSRHNAGPGGDVLRKVLIQLEEGRTLAQALDADASFDRLLVALVRAAEQTSDLPKALQRYLDHARQSQAVRQRLVTTAIYPLVLLAVGSAVVVFLLTYVIPRFSSIFASIHVELPWAAVALLAWGDFVRNHAYGLAGLALVASALLVWAATSNTVRARLLGWLMARGWVGAHLRGMYLARLYRSVGTLLWGGIPFTRSLQMSAELLPAGMQHAVMQALDEVKSGQTPSVALARQGLTSPVADQLLKAGEQSGALADMLDKAASFHEGETARTVERFMRAFEPVVMTLIGLLVGGIVVLMYLPIFELASAIQ